MSTPLPGTETPTRFFEGPVLAPGQMVELLTAVQLAAGARFSTRANMVARRLATTSASQNIDTQPNGQGVLALA